MMLPSFATQSVIIERPAYRNSHGNKVPDWDDVTQNTVAGCSIEPATGSNSGDHRDAVLSQKVIWMPAGTDVQGRDRIVISGTHYRIVGDPQVFETGVLDHVEVTLTNWEG